MGESIFDPKRDHRITREEAASLVLSFQSRTDTGAHYSSTYNRSAFEQLLAQSGAAGIRIYLAQHADGSPTMVMVAVDEKGLDIAAPGAVFINSGHECPPWCAPSGLF